MAKYNDHGQVMFEVIQILVICILIFIATTSAIKLTATLYK